MLSTSEDQKMANFKTKFFVYFLIFGLSAEIANTQSTATTSSTQTTETSTGTQTTASSSGTQSTATSTGTQTTAASTGTQSTATSTGTQTTATSTASKATTESSSTQTSASTSDTQTTAATAATQTKATRLASPIVPCPDGKYNDITNTVTFTLDDKECQITVYLSKPPKGKKIKAAKKEKSKKSKKEKSKKAKEENISKSKDVEPVEQGERFIEKDVSIGPIPGRDIDMCAEVSVSKYNKDVFSIQAGDCVMYVKKPKKGKHGSTIPIMRTESNRSP